ncbi:MAG TPA: class I SAM-dependent methyltransferase [Chloroflexi bacterium]|nr:MAG: class I SAM-dependent methyltransferase [Chloroflexota bacterium]HDD56103.1 class I SAM-dependent methyltransferase [Chloroflexota bacterium]
MVDHKQAYQQEGEKYQRLIACEDYQGNLLPAIREVIRFDGLDVVDLGTGTGRLARLLGPAVRSVYAFDISAHMLGVAKEIFAEFPGYPWLAAAAEHQAIPLPQNSADLVLSGWSFCYLAVWAEKNGQAALLEGLREIKRVLRERGSLVLIETLGTGVKEPHPPEKLLPYFNYLGELGFKRSWIRTDYKFHDREAARELVKFFFGEEMLINISQDEEPILPECTGIWWCHVIDLLTWKGR